MRRSRPLPVRLLALVLLAVQLVPASVLHAEEPPSPTSHVAHIGAPGDGCEPAHDSEHCTVCRVLGNHVVEAASGTGLHALPAEADLPLHRSQRVAASGDPATHLDARAPPSS